MQKNDTYETICFVKIVNSYSDKVGGIITNTYDLLIFIHDCIFFSSFLKLLAQNAISWYSLCRYKSSLCAQFVKTHKNKLNIQTNKYVYTSGHKAWIPITKVTARAVFEKKYSGDFLALNTCSYCIWHFNFFYSSIAVAKMRV